MKKEEKEVEILIGKTPEGKSIYVDFCELPHLLIGGCNGSGKSNFILHLINSLMKKRKPEELKFILADPKKMEFEQFKKSPYLFMPLAFAAKQVSGSLDWLVEEMEERFRTLENSRTMNIISYNKKAKERMLRLVFIVDEMLGFMDSGERGINKRIEESLVRLCQLGRAVGIHVVLATSDPNYKCISGLLHANLNARLAFKTHTGKDSYKILYNSEAKELNGNGDALFWAHFSPKLIRLQTPAAQKY